MGNPKAIANRIKSKGLQKLRWYCQMCQKQCRDEVTAGLCKVDETPKGWYIQYIDRDPETIRRQQEQERKKKQDLDDEEKTAKFIEQQVRRGLEGKELEMPVYTELNRENEEEKVTFNLNKGASTSVAASSKTSVLGQNALKMVEGAVKRKDAAHSSGQLKEKKKKSALDEIMELEEEKKRTSRRDYWLQPEIIVKIVTKKLGEKYHKKKAVVKEVIDKYTAVVKGPLKGRRVEDIQMFLSLSPELTSRSSQGTPAESFSSTTGLCVQHRASAK
ncbi:hypothetical protein IHE44_0012644 [Lamprotornis superbus]|uniref:DNA/RNA-binding protein Kin17 WH-like domain-containing protein n=1 Tax=Lamprotornis superbus TaxID=245042 RepID=A0A835TYM1_9PASS|nr:hypothetical protein IHE44_0012644 [Lamprotornis superbus]